MAPQMRSPSSSPWMSSLDPAPRRSLISGYTVARKDACSSVGNGQCRYGRFSSS